MNLVDVKKTIAAAGLRTLRFAGLLAIGITVGALTAEMFPKPVAAAAHPCEMEYCDHHFPLWWWQSDMCRYSDSNTDCTFLLTGRVRDSELLRRRRRSRRPTAKLRGLWGL